MTFNTLPDARFIFSDAPQLSPVASKFHVLSPSPESTVNPAPSAAASSAAPVATWKFLSSIATVVLLMVVVVPLTVKLPETVKLSSTVVVPPAESITKFPEDVSISLLLVTPI